MNEKQPKMTARLVECNDELMEDFDDFGPITITLNKPEDVLFLHTACLVYTCKNNMDAAERVLILMAKMAAESGPEKAVDMMIDEGKNHGFFFPDFYKPLCLAMLKHSMNKARKDQDESQ